MKFGNFSFALIAYLTASVLMTSCGDKKEKAQQELETSGYEATPADFLRAAENGDVRALELFAEQDMNLNTKDDNGWTAMHLGSRAGKQESVAFLLEAGVDIDIPGLDSVTPLMLAAREGQQTMVRYLLRQGAKAELKDDKKRTALILAVDGNHPACIEELAPYSRAGLDTALLYAAAQGKHKVIETLTSYGASVYARHTGGMTPLMLAAQKGHEDTVNALLESGANRYAINEQGWTAAQIAAASSRGNIARTLDQEPAAEELAITEHEETGEIAWTVPTPSEEDKKNPELKPSPQAGNTTIPFVTDKKLWSPSEEPASVAKNIRMIDYHEKPLPLMLEKTQPSPSGGSEAQVRMLYGKQNKVVVKQGDTIPGTRFKVVDIRRMLNHSKITDGKPTDVSVVEIEDTTTGKRRKMTARIPATAAEPWAVLVNDISAGKYYAARAGQSFTVNGTTRYTVTDVRPTQIILTNEYGETVTIPMGR
jgi:ankyrin repeat protein